MINFYLKNGQTIQYKMKTPKEESNLIKKIKDGKKLAEPTLASLKKAGITNLSNISQIHHQNNEKPKDEILKMIRYMVPGTNLSEHSFFATLNSTCQKTKKRR